MTSPLQQKVDVAQYAVLAYKDEADLMKPGALPADVTLVDKKIEGGFVAYAFRNNATGQIVVAFRGTDSVPEFFKNIPPILGAWDSEINLAASFVDQVRKQGVRLGILHKDVFAEPWLMRRDCAKSSRDWQPDGGALKGSVRNA